MILLHTLYCLQLSSFFSRWFQASLSHRLLTSSNYFLVCWFSVSLGVPVKGLSHKICGWFPEGVPYPRPFSVFNLLPDAVLVCPRRNLSGYVEPAQMYIPAVTMFLIRNACFLTVGGAVPSGVGFYTSSRIVDSRRNTGVKEGSD